MKQQELIERYIYAVTRFMKKEEKEDVAKELRSIIADMVEERCGDEEPGEETVKEILSELGNPRGLYEKYSEDGKDCLIGVPYYGMYKYVMKTALICVCIGLMFAQLMVCFIDMPVVAAGGMGVFFVNMITEVCATVFDGAALTFAAVTLWFAVMYHKEIKMDFLEESLDKLPQIPKKEAAISKKSISFDIMFTVLFYAIFLACPEVLCMYEVETGVVTPMFQEGYMQRTWYLIVAFGVLGIGRECVKLMEGTYTKRLVLVTAVVDMVSAVLAALWLATPQAINPAFSEGIRALFADESAAFTPFVNLMVNFNIFFLICILFALAVDLGAVVWKYYKSQK